ncbi:MAG: Maf family protein [Gemmataceae bacterium]
MGRDFPFRLTLASGSLGRRELLTRHGYTFTIRPSDFDEPTDAPHGDIRRYVAEMCWNKANAVAEKVPDGVILAADTVGWYGGAVIGKPTDANDAARIIRLLAGKTHDLWTGVTLWHRPTNWQLSWQELSRVAMAPLTESQIADYLLTRKWEGCSGAYTLEFPVDPYLSVVEGSVSNVIGLPMESLAVALEWWARGLPGRDGGIQRNLSN